MLNKLNRYRLALAAAFLITAGGPSALAIATQAGEHLVIPKGKGEVEFRAIGHPSALKIIGKGSALQADFRAQDKALSGTAKFELSDFNTGIALRDRHMKEKYLEVQKYPEAQFTLTRLELPQPLDKSMEAKHVPFTGKLSLHGKEHAVSGFADVQSDGKAANFVAAFGVKIADYGIAPPSFAGISMGDDVEISVKGDAPLHSN